MKRAMKWFLTGATVITFAAFVSTSRDEAQEKKPWTNKHDTKMLFDSLRNVINTGADLFNNKRDYSGCYRLYQGALLSVKPFLPAEMQTRVDEAFGKAERMTSMADRAFELRAMIDVIRDDIRGGPAVSSLWDRLGGSTNVEKVVNEFLATAGNDPKVNVTRGGKIKITEADRAHLKIQVIAFISAASGGPIKYTGKAMKDAHKGMGITDAEFDAAAGHMRKALEKYGAKPADADALLNAVGGTRKDIVEPPAKKNEPKKGGDQNEQKKTGDDKKDTSPKDETQKEETARTSGKVVYKGQPVGGAYLTLVSSSNRRYSTILLKDGTYTFRTPLPVGVYKAFLEVERDLKPSVAIPDRFRVLAASGLEVRVVAGETKADLTLND